MTTNVTFTATGLGVLIGCIFNEIEVALNITPLIFFPMMLFSGFYVNSESVRWFVKWLEWISPFRYGLEAAIYNEFDNTNFVPNPITALAFDYGYWESMGYLLIIGGVVRIIGFIALFINAKMS
jgi:ATP-binding cassette subfamily G (WHITE) protein 2